MNPDDALLAVEAEVEAAQRALDEAVDIEAAAVKVREAADTRYRRARRAERDLRQARRDAWARP